MTPRTNALTKTNIALWVAQALLALLFLMAGGSKLTMPAEAMTAQVPAPIEFLRLIGIAETMGALGLILPGIFRIKTGLTPLAAAGLVIVMNGATGFTLAAGSGAQAVVPFIIGVVLAAIAYARWRVVPLGSPAVWAGPRAARAAA
jgi:uncharacterized membrane protein YphA (DoxX/SURF4 family)